MRESASANASAVGGRRSGRLESACKTRRSSSAGRSGRSALGGLVAADVVGIVEEVGPAVKHVKPGDYVTCTVRRPGGSIYDTIGRSDITSEETYYERGINLLHGFLTEYYVDDPEYIVKVPQGLKNVAVLLEPASIVEKGIAQAWEIQRRMRVWRPRDRKSTRLNSSHRT